MELNMNQTASNRWSGREALVVMALLVWPAVGAAQLVSDPTITSEASTTSAPSSASGLSGQAAAVLASTLAGMTSLADTGTLDRADDVRHNSLLTGAVPSLLAGETLRATTIGWTDQVDSNASITGLVMEVAGIGITADVVMASATAVLGAPGSGSSLLDNLSINGTRVAVDGTANQVLDIPGGRVVINEQASSAGGMVVNALHVTVDGVADVVVGAASAAVQ
jgi:hypothetical protein